jgi:hypothetical protein
MLRVQRHCIARCAPAGFFEHKKVFANLDRGDFTKATSLIASQLRVSSNARPS